MRNPYINNIEEGVIDRRTRCGCGVPTDDMFIFNGEITYGNLQQKWKCLVCGYGGYINMNGVKFLACCHATLLSSKTKNERRGIPEHGEFIAHNEYMCVCGAEI